MLTLIAAIGLTSASAEPIVDLSGSDLTGGAASIYGSHQHGIDDTNWVYAQPTGEQSSLSGEFTLARLPRAPMFLFLTAVDDDYASKCAIRISLNDATLFEGESTFSDAPGWQSLRFEIPSGTLKVGGNELLIENTHAEGKGGMPPWFMVARATIADRSYRAPRLQATMPLSVRLPKKLRPFPEPLAEGSEPGFKLRGTKGWMWTPEQYLAEIPVLAEYQMNFLMNCYGSLFDFRPHWVNEWWTPMSDELKAGLIQVIESCREHGITYCFAAHPQLASPRPMDPRSMTDREAFWQRFEWAQQQGVKWFNISIDDVSWGDRGAAAGGSEHADLINWFLERLRANDPEAQLTMVPVPYWGDGTSPDHRAYLESLAREMHPDVYVFWTGDAVVTPKITRAAAESYREIVDHRLILWDNYPVNDNAPTLHLGPVTGRDADLCEVIDGYMSNPLCKQNQANRIPLLTCADYAYNPSAYDPARSIGQAIAHLASGKKQRRALADLVEAYPGMLIYGGGTGMNPVRTEFGRLSTDPKEAAQFAQRIQSLATRFATAFPDDHAPARAILEADAAWLAEQP